MGKENERKITLFNNEIIFCFVILTTANNPPINIELLLE